MPRTSANTAVAVVACPPLSDWQGRTIMRCAKVSPTEVVSQRLARCQQSNNVVIRRRAAGTRLRRAGASVEESLTINMPPSPETRNGRVQQLASRPEIESTYSTYNRQSVGRESIDEREN